MQIFLRNKNRTNNTKVIKLISMFKIEYFNIVLEQECFVLNLHRLNATYPSSIHLRFIFSVSNMCVFVHGIYWRTSGIHDSIS